VDLIDSARRLEHVQSYQLVPVGSRGLKCCAAFEWKKKEEKNAQMEMKIYILLFF